jgi:hypothetical protein
MKIMADEISPSSVETPDEVQTPPPPAPVQTNQPAPPPASVVVVNGVKSEREIELEGLLASRDETLSVAERRALEAERRAAELERDNQTLREIPVPKPPKVKRERSIASIILGDEDEE